MKKLETLFLAAFICAILNSCNFDDVPTQLNNEPKVAPIDTAAMVESINSYETQPIDKIVVFQVFEGKEYSKVYKHHYQSCLAKTYKYNKNHRYKFDEYEEINSSSLYITFDDKVMLYDDLEIKANDFIMIDTYSYDTRSGKAFGVEIPSQRATVPVYVKRSELLKLFGQ